MIGLGSSSTLGLGIIIELRDKFTKNANNISNALSKVHGSAEKTLKSTFNTMIGVGTTLTAVGVAVTMGMRNATNEAIQFEKVLINIKALGELSNSEMSSLGRLAQSLGPKYGKSAIDVAKGMEDLVKAGLKAKEIPSVMEAILQTAIASSEALEGKDGVAARMTDILMAWGFQANQAGRVGDILAKASVESTVSFNDLAESMKYSQDILRSMGLTFEESVAMMAVLGNAGIKASMAGTSLGNAWREVAIAIGGGNKKKDAALSALGLNKAALMDAYGNLKRPLEILDKIKLGLRGMGDIQRQNVLNDLFGVRGKRGINPLIDFLMRGPNDKFMGKSLSEMIQELQSGSVGENLRIFDEKSKSIAFQSQKLASNWINFKIAVGNSLTSLLGDTLPILNKIMENLISFAKSGTGSFLIKTLAVVGAILIPLGLMVTTLGLIGRSLLFLRTSSLAFGRASLWVWNTLIARALTYLGVMGGVGAGQKLNSAGRVIDAVTGRFVKTTPGMFPWLSRLGAGFIRLLPILGTVARAFTLIGSVSLGLSLLGIDFKTQVDLVWGSIKWILGSIANAVMGILEWIPGVDLGGGGWSKRQDQVNYGGPLPANYYERSEKIKIDNQNYESPYSRRMKLNRGDTNVHIYVDGEKTISKKINEGNENELNSRYGYSH